MTDDYIKNGWTDYTEPYRQANTVTERKPLDWINFDKQTARCPVSQNCDWTVITIQEHSLYLLIEHIAQHVRELEEENKELRMAFAYARYLKRKRSVRMNVQS